MNGIVVECGVVDPRLGGAAGLETRYIINKGRRPDCFQPSFCPSLVHPRLLLALALLSIASKVLIFPCFLSPDRAAQAHSPHQPT